jgi:glycosyltransferase involved in cell wall biosynthesis
VRSGLCLQGQFFRGESGVCVKVLHIMNELRPSGAEVMLELAAPIWQRLGWRLQLLAVAESPGPFAERLEKAGWEVAHVPRDGSASELIDRVSRMVRKLAPDVVHLHQEGKSLPLCRAVHRTGTPMLRTVHNNFPFGGLLRHRKTLERWLCRRMGLQHVSISSSVRDNERSRFRNPTELCWNWFDASRFRPPTEGEKLAARARLGIPADRRVLVSMGNGSDIKNYRAVVEAVAIIGDPSIHYYQVGNPHTGGVDAALARDLGIPGQVHFPGPTSAVLDWLWASDVYVMPSIFEGYGLAAVEALAAGCACVFADCPGLADFRAFEISAQWVHPEPTTFASAIAAALRRPLSPAEAAANSERVRSEFAVEHRAGKYHEMWLRFLRSPSA